ncbi:hypothetical protein B0H10DRAFT_1952227 [Mycena sp. CBHHK59/15]|nr:hypothetical protein B0H10DRAFT_1952227 [Mycena sp. CBHHK59/15]
MAKPRKKSLTTHKTARCTAAQHRYTCKAICIAAHEVDAGQCISAVKEGGRRERLRKAGKREGSRIRRGDAEKGRGWGRTEFGWERAVGRERVGGKRRTALGYGEGRECGAKYQKPRTGVEPKRHGGRVKQKERKGHERSGADIGENKQAGSGAIASRSWIARIGGEGRWGRGGEKWDAVVVRRPFHPLPRLVDSMSVSNVSAASASVPPASSTFSSVLSVRTPSVCEQRAGPHRAPCTGRGVWIKGQGVWEGCAADQRAKEGGGDRKGVVASGAGGVEVRAIGGGEGCGRGLREDGEGERVRDGRSTGGRAGPGHAQWRVRALRSIAHGWAAACSRMHSETCDDTLLAHVHGRGQEGQQQPHVNVRTDDEAEADGAREQGGREEHVLNQHRQHQLGHGTAQDVDVVLGLELSPPLVGPASAAAALCAAISSTSGLGWESGPRVTSGGRQAAGSGAVGVGIVPSEGRAVGQPHLKHMGHNVT